MFLRASVVKTSCPRTGVVNYTAIRKRKDIHTIRTICGWKEKIHVLNSWSIRVLSSCKKGMNNPLNGSNHGGTEEHKQLLG